MSGVSSKKCSKHPGVEQEPPIRWETARPAFVKNLKAPGAAETFNVNHVLPHTPSSRNNCGKYAERWPHTNMNIGLRNTPECLMHDFLDKPNIVDVCGLGYPGRSADLFRKRQGASFPHLFQGFPGRLRPPKPQNRRCPVCQKRMFQTSWCRAGTTNKVGDGVACFCEESPKPLVPQRPSTSTMSSPHTPSNPPLSLRTGPMYLQAV